MKKLLSIFASLTLCISALAPVASIVATSAALTACKSTQQATAYKSIASVQASVEVALGAWSDYIVSRKREIANLPEPDRAAESTKLASRETKARAALESYKSAASMAIAVAKSGAAPAPAALVSSASNFIESTK